MDSVDKAKGLWPRLVFSGGNIVDKRAFAGGYPVDNRGCMAAFFLKIPKTGCAGIPFPKKPGISLFSDVLSGRLSSRPEAALPSYPHIHIGIFHRLWKAEAGSGACQRRKGGRYPQTYPQRKEARQAFFSLYRPRLPFWDKLRAARPPFYPAISRHRDAAAGCWQGTGAVSDP